MINYESYINNFFNSVMDVLNASKSATSDAVAIREIDENIKRVREIARLPHLFAAYNARLRIQLNPTARGFVSVHGNVYPEFIATLNAIDMFYNSDMPNKTAILADKVNKWNNAIAAGRFNRFVAKLTQARRSLFVHSK